jgi:hypothetical protein
VNTLDSGRTSDLPFLKRLARKYLCGQATSVASERVFSTAGDTVKACRSRLLPDEVNKLIFLKKNAFDSD